MHTLIVLLTIFAIWRMEVWRNWRKYHATLLFFSLGNLTYNFVSANYFLWRFIPEIFSNQTVTELLYTFIVFPGSLLIFLSHYPKGKFKILLHYIKWFILYIGIEWLMMSYNLIEYNYGWNIWWSSFFILFMFPLLYLHYKRPLLAYILAIIMGVSITIYFNIPIEVPIENR